MVKKSKVKALVLFSGGLDSRLVVKLLQDQDIETELVYFKLPFGCSCCNDSSCNFNFSQLNRSRLHIMDCTKGKLFKKYLQVVRNPKYGYGKGMNPCIHCRIFMLGEAKKIMKSLDCKFIATGEVLGQRPMSQYKQALFNIEKESKLVGKILRPLSAKVLPVTKMEKEGLIDREKLLGIVGRKRNIQIQLANQYNIKFPNPAGGCLLSDNEYSIRLLDLLKQGEPSFWEIESLSGFRHFRNKGKIILGKNHEENIRLIELNKKLKYNIITPAADNPGPTCVYQNGEDKIIADDLIKAYSSKDLSLRNKFEHLRIKSI
jgi:tRNA U34 2-thiouridine synthase MnmA/TrmU